MSSNLTPPAAPKILPPISIPKDGEEIGPYRGASGKELPQEEYRRRLLLVACMRHAGYSYPEITEATGFSAGQIRYAMARAHELKLGNVALNHRLDNVALPLAVEGLIGVLEDPLHDRHYDAVRDTLHGRGEFRNHSHSQVESKNLNLNMVVEYEMPGGAPVPAVVQLTEELGLMHGTPREDDAVPSSGD